MAVLKKRKVARKPILADRYVEGTYKQGTLTRMEHLRRLLILHSYIYYKMNKTLVTDTQYDAWAYELVDLNKSYPRLVHQGQYASDFADWDGSTGFDLPSLADLNVQEWALRTYRSLTYIPEPRKKIVKKRKKVIRRA